MRKKVKCDRNDIWVGYDKDGTFVISSKFKIGDTKHVVELEFSEEEYKKIIGEMAKARFHYEKNKLRFKVQEDKTT